MIIRLILSLLFISCLTVSVAYGETFRAVLIDEPLHLDPHGSINPAAWPIIFNSYYRLTTLNPNSGEALPSLAKTIRVSDNGLRYIFVLNEDLTFSDGQKLNSEAVHFSFDRLMSKETGKKYFSPLKRIEIIGPYTFALILDVPMPSFLNALASVPASIVSPGLMDKPENYLNKNTLGGGRYLLKNWQPGEITLEIRPESVNVPRIDKAIFYYSSNAESRYKLFTEKHAHLLLEPDKKQSFSDLYQEVFLTTFKSRYLAFNQKLKFSEKEQGEISQAILDLSLGGEFFAVKIPSLIPAALYPSSEVPKLKTDIQKESGVFLFDNSTDIQVSEFLENDLPKSKIKQNNLVLAILSPADPQELAEAQLIVTALALKGYEVKTVVELENKISQGEYDLFLGTKKAGNGVPYEWLKSLFFSENIGTSNTAFIKNQEIDRLIVEISENVEALVRAKQVSELFNLAHESNAYLFLYQIPHKVLVDKRLNDYTFHPLWPNVWPLDKMYLSPFKVVKENEALTVPEVIPPLADDPNPLNL